MIEHETYFLKTAAAFVRGRFEMGEKVELTDDLRTSPLDDLTQDQLIEILYGGINSGLKLHKFKRTMGLARVRRVIGALRSLLPDDLLDVGSGRGAFLWPLLEEFSARVGYLCLHWLRPRVRCSTGCEWPVRRESADG